MEFAIGQKALADATASLVFLFCFTLVGPVSRRGCFILQASR